MYEKMSLNNTLSMSEVINTFRIGSEVLYFYRHFLNSKSSFINTKKGTIVGYGYKDKKPILKVKINGNKTISRISYKNLELCDK